MATYTNLKKYDDGKEYNVTVDGTHYDPSTPSEILEALEYARAIGTSIRIFHGFTEQYNPDNKPIGEAWPEENAVIGRIGRTTGRKSPMLVHNARSMGGQLISTNSIVAIKIKHRWLYQHPKFTTGKWEVVALAGSTRFQALHNRELHAQFDHEKQAQRYCDFMSGKRFAR